VFELLRAGRPLLVNLGEPGRLELGGWADRVTLIEATYDGDWVLPVIGQVDPPAAVLVRSDGYVAWVDAPGTTDAGLGAALSSWCGSPA
jgi:3-(3-hydroxy-phenyl)propionate hydroxylase